MHACPENNVLATEIGASAGPTHIFDRLGMVVVMVVVEEGIMMPVIYILPIGTVVSLVKIVLVAVDAPSIVVALPGVVDVDHAGQPSQDEGNDNRKDNVGTHVWSVQEEAGLQSTLEGARAAG